MQYSIVNYNNLENESLRLDAEYYHPKYLELDKEFEEYICEKISFFSEVTDGEHGSVDYQDNGIRYLTAENIKQGYVDLKNIKYVDDSVDERNKRARVSIGDILVSIKGTLGEIALAESWLIPANMNRDVAIIKFQLSSYNPEYVAIFLMSRIGQLQAIREGSGGVQQMITLGRLRNIKVPKLDSWFQDSIKKVYFISAESRNKSKKLYQQAQTLLLSELGLLDWKLKHCQSFIKNYSDTQQAGRFDAEYFQPKYDEIVAMIKSHAGGWDTIGNLVSLKKCIEVGSDEYSDEGIPFIRVSNLSPFEITEEKYISEKLYSELTPKEKSDVTFETSKNHQPKKGEILFSKDATPGIAYFLNEEPPKMIPSGGILRLKLKDKRIKPSYLTLVLNSIIVQEQINRDVGGSVILHWRPDQIEKTLIPIFKDDKQDIIQQNIIESFNLRKQSKHLLECARKAVEMAIEKDEETAMQWLGGQLGSIEMKN